MILHSGPPAYQRWLALILIAIGWFLFANLAGATVDRVREFPGWSNFLVFSLENSDSTYLNERSEVVQFSSRQSSPTATAQIVRSIISTDTEAPSRRSSGTTPTSVFNQEIFWPPICGQSGESHFNQIGQRGEITRNIRIRTSPSNTSGTEIISGMSFVIIGPSRCAIPNGYSAEMLFLNVRLVGVSNNRTGWIPESGIGSSGTIVYNVYPSR